jgi:hypothetical protein
MNTKVISASNLPPKPPVTLMIASYLLMQHLSSPGWVYGVVFTILGVAAIASIIRMGLVKPTDIFKNDK